MHFLCQIGMYEILCLLLFRITLVISVTYMLIVQCEICPAILFLPFQEPLYLDKCIVCSEVDWEDYFEVQELISKDTFIFKVRILPCN
jgi:hypothetical protein